MSEHDEGGMGHQPRTPPRASADRHSERGSDEHTADRGGAQRAQRDHRAGPGHRDDHGAEALGRGTHYAREYQRDERRFERQSDFGVRGEGGDVYRYGGTREQSGRHGEPTGEPIPRGASGTSSGSAGQEDSDHLGPYQDSWSLGTGRQGRGLSDDDGDVRSDGQPMRGYSAMAGSRYASETRRGRGPRNYRRSDERILEDVCERLMEDDYVDAADIEVQVQDGVVTLTGTVHERWEKHRAEDITDACSGVREVENRIRVSSARRGPSARESGGPGAATSSSSDGGSVAPGDSAGSGMQQPADTRADRNEIGNSG